MPRRESNEEDAEQPQVDGRPIAIDSKADSADPSLPAFLAPPAGAPAYHGFPILSGVELDGWRLGLITDSVGSNHTAGDAYLIAPDGRRAGLVWRIERPTWFSEIIGPEPKRFGVFEVATNSGPTSIDGARQFLAEILPAVKEAWERSTP